MGIQYPTSQALLPPGSSQGVPGQVAVRAEVRLQHPDPVSDSLPGNGAPCHGFGRSLGPLCQGEYQV